MNITVMRIDDRLIHGQIVTVWISDANAKKIIVVDDKASKDDMQKMLLRLAIPSGISLEILTKKEGIEKFSQDKTSSNCLLIMRNPAEVLEFIKLGFRINKINLGNVSNSKSETGRKKVLDYVYLEENDYQSLKEITELGVEFDIRAIPTENSKNFKYISEKYNK